jgi:hypothetical protein
MIELLSLEGKKKKRKKRRRKDFYSGQHNSEGDQSVFEISWKM